MKVVQPEKAEESTWFYLEGVGCLLVGAEIGGGFLNGIEQIL